MKGADAQPGIVSQDRSVVREQMLDCLACLAPGGTAEGEKRIQDVGGENCQALEFRKSKMATLLEDRQIENKLADCNADAGARVLGRLENSEGQVLDRKMRIRLDVDE